MPAYAERDEICRIVHTCSHGEALELLKNHMIASIPFRLGTFNVLSVESSDDSWSIVDQLCFLPHPLMMNLLVRLLASALFVIATAAKGDAPVDQFHEFHRKSAPVKLDDGSFSKLTALPRNHTSAVLLTALETRFGCQLCKDFQPEWDLLAKSWKRGDHIGDSKIIFGTLDFVDGKQTFQSVR